MKKRKFDDGGMAGDELEAANNSPESIAIRDEMMASAPKAQPQKQSFKDAFAEARSGGAKTFEWNGKKFTTEMAKPSAAKAPARDTGDDTARMAARAPAPAKKSTYETPYDRMNRQNREAGKDVGSAVSSMMDRSGDRLVRSKPQAGSQKFLGAGYKSGGKVSASRRGDGIAQRGKTRGRLV